MMVEPQHRPALSHISTESTYSEDVGADQHGVAHVHLLGDMLLGASLMRPGMDEQLLSTAAAVGVRVANTPVGLLLEIPSDNGGLCASTTVGVVHVHAYSLAMTDTAADAEQVTHGAR